MSKKINSKFLGKRFGNWVVTGVKRSDKYMGKTSDSYAYTYKLTNAKKEASVTVTGNTMSNLATRKTNMSTVLAGKKYCVARKIYTRANKVSSLAR